jgi:hypothetical protein
VGRGKLPCNFSGEKFMKRIFVITISLILIALAAYEIGYLFWLNATEVPFWAMQLRGLVMGILLSVSTLAFGIYLLKTSK